MTASPAPGVYSPDQGATTLAAREAFLSAAATLTLPATVATPYGEHVDVQRTVTHLAAALDQPTLHVLTALLTAEQKPVRQVPVDGRYPHCPCCGPCPEKFAGRLHDTACPACDEASA